MEKKRQLEKLQKLRRYAQLTVSKGKEKKEKRNAASIFAQEPPAEQPEPAKEETEQPKQEQPTQQQQPETPAPVETEESKAQNDALSDLISAAASLPETDSTPAESEPEPEPEAEFIEQTLEEQIEAYEVESAIAGACEELLDVSEEVDLLTEAAEIVEAQQRAIQEYVNVIKEQEQLLIKQKETIVHLERELASLRGQSCAPTPVTPSIS